MSIDGGSDLDHRVSWPDVWAGLGLVALVGVAAVSAAVLVSDGSPTTPNADRQAGSPRFPLVGVQDPGRPGWRSTSKGRDPTGLHEVAPEPDDKLGEESGGKPWQGSGAHGCS
jgi:hypothetical protein